ncbi:MAG: MazG family protein [Homoserinimonas sp.]|nr:MazG family protein [Homoserinimonas sp.]
MASAHPKLDELIEVLARLRAPGGCAWDADQTHESLVRYLVEECYELAEAIETGDRDGMLEELGDVLYQVVFHADIASQSPVENFDIEDVAAHMTAKMISRHPHVFGDDEARTALDIQSADDVVAVWDQLKAADKPNRSSVLDGIPNSMPALALAEKLLGRAEKVGVSVDGQTPADAPRISASPGLAGTQVGCATSMPTDAPPANEAELGSLLLGIVSSARARGLDPERALRSALRDLRAQIRAAEAA